MLIQLTDLKGKDVYINVDNLLYFREGDNGDGYTKLTMASPSDYHTLLVREEAYKVWARIRAEGG